MKILIISVGDKVIGNADTPVVCGLTFITKGNAQFQLKINKNKGNYFSVQVQWTF